MRHYILKQFLLFLAITLGSYTATAGQDTIQSHTPDSQEQKYNYQEEYLEEIKAMDKVIDELTGEEVDKPVVPQVDNTHQEVTVSDDTLVQ